MHEWMLDNGFTPHIVVDAKREGVRVPEAHVKDGKIVLNVSPSATHGLVLGNDFVSFGARFGGVSFELVVPVAAVLGIYARETGQGMIFADEDASPSPPAGEPSAAPTPDDDGGPRTSPPSGARARLKVVK